MIYFSDCQFLIKARVALFQFLFEHQLFELLSRASDAVDRIGLVDQQLQKHVHYFLLADNEVDVSVYHGDCQAFPAVERKLVKLVHWRLIYVFTKHLES